MEKWIFKTAFFIGGAVTGFLLNKIINRIWGASLIAFNKKNTKKRIDALKENNIKDIIVLEEIVPYCRTQNIKTRILPEKNYIISENESVKIDSEIVLSLSVILDMQIEEMATVLEKIRTIVREQFIYRTCGNYFNGKLFGVLRSDAHSRTEDAAEEPIFQIEFFKTDYFTHKVVEQLIRNHGAGVIPLNAETLNCARYNCIRTSFGLNVIVILRHTNQIILTKRSKSAAYSDGVEWIYVSVTETASETDETNGTVELKYALKRGLKEELGIEESMLYESTIKFYDHFYESNFYQDNIVASVELDEDISLDKLLTLKAKDKQLEVNNIFAISNTARSIEKFIKDNENKMRSQTIFALKSYAARIEKMVF